MEVLQREPGRAAHAAGIAMCMADKFRVHAIAEDPPRPELRNAVVPAINVGKATAENDHVGINDVHDVRKRSCESVLVTTEGRVAGSVASCGPRDDFL